MKKCSKASCCSKKKWSELTTKQKRMTGGAVAIDLVAKATAWHYLYHLPASKIRGPKPLWALITTFVGTLGPIAFLVGGIKHK